MATRSTVVRTFVTAIVFGALVVIASSPLFAQAIIPAGSTITKADLHLYAHQANGMTVRLYPITADWDEALVTWNSFNGAFDPYEVGSFAATPGWNTVDVTALVQEWLDGDRPNFGIYLTQGGSEYSIFLSSELLAIHLRPSLEISFVTPSGNVGAVFIQRPGDDQDGVRDASILEIPAWANSPLPWPMHLFTGFDHLGWEKASLVRFHFIVAPGTGTPGYWKNHPDAWPVDEIEIGGNIYTKSEAITLMEDPGKKDKTFTMFESLVAAKLNLLIGNDGSCILPEIQAADVWMAAHPVGSEVQAGGKASAWREGEPIHQMLDDYNNGLLPCAEHRD